MSRPLAVIAVVGLFLAGVLAGVLGTHLFYLHELREPGGLAELGTRAVARNLERRLDLTPSQKQQIEEILADTRTEVTALRRRMVPEVRAILRRTRVRVARVLTPEQRRELQRMQRRQRFLDDLLPEE